ncbi:hypothetical protein [Wolbachia endosymbiont (group B) of Germaria angustata]|uniref:TomO hydrophobic C-terminal domain-containing protein n=1 Tax=Wolbachia endosymbiont (group B) of Germaria angustata TaxID=3077916 RepID=UPI00313336F9
MLSRSNVGFRKSAVNNTALRAQNQTTSGQSTTKLFKAIDEENLGDFERALAEGANVNEFDKEGLTPLMSIANSYVASSDGQAALEKMAKLLIQKRIININAQSEQPVYKEEHKRDQFGRPVYLFRGEEVAEVRPLQYIYCSNGQNVDNIDDQGTPILFNYIYDGVRKSVRTSFIQKDTALHIACWTGAVDIVKRLLTHPDVKADIKNYHNKVPKDLITRGFEDIIELEFQKAQTGKELLNALSNRNIDQAKRLLNQDFNPNCWKRNSNGEMETPLSLICLQGITESNEEVLRKLLKHKELDFSQIKPIPAIEQNSRLKQIIEQAMKERLTDAINRKDLNDVKKLVEGNCFINRAIITDVLRNVNEPIHYLNEKFPASMEQPSANTHNVQPEINDEFISQELQRLENLKGELKRTKARLTEKEKELNRVVSEKTRDTNKISQLERDLRQERSAQQTRISTLTNQVTQLTREKSQLENLRDELERTKTQLRKKEQELDRVVSERDTNKISQLKRDFSQQRSELQTQNQDLNNKNRKLSEASIYNRRQSNYSSASFVLSGAFAVGSCLTVSNLEICISLAVAAFVFLTIGCYCSYKASTVLSDVTSTEFGNVISL